MHVCARSSVSDKYEIDSYTYESVIIQLNAISCRYIGAHFQLSQLVSRLHLARSAIQPPPPGGGANQWGGPADTSALVEEVGTESAGLILEDEKAEGVGTLGFPESFGLGVGDGRPEV